MSRVIKFSTTFPKGHLREGKPTFFVEKLNASLDIDMRNTKWLSLLTELNPNLDKQIIANFVFNDIIDYNPQNPKWTTIRKNHKWQVGDKFSPRIWSGKPYNSKQIILAPDITITNVFDVTIENIKQRIVININNDRFEQAEDIEAIAAYDGLSLTNFLWWFDKLPFTGQIITWSKELDYSHLLTNKT